MSPSPVIWLFRAFDSSPLNEAPSAFKNLAREEGYRLYIYTYISLHCSLSDTPDQNPVDNILQAVL